MRRTIVLAMVLCLTIAVLTLGAAPAIAQEGCDCHTADPPTATAAHAPFVASVTDCTTCHVGWTVPHPTAVEATLTLRAGGKLGMWRVSGGLYAPWLPLPGVTVYLQRKAADAADYGDWRSIVTDARGFYDTGWFRPGAAYDYRAVSPGVAGPPLVLPSLSVAPVARPKPELTLQVRGFTYAPLTPFTVKLGRTLTVRGTVTPTDLAGKKVTIQVRKRQRATGDWVTRVTVKRTISATGTYRWSWTPKSRGEYRVGAAIPSTAAYERVATRFPSGPLTITVY